MKIGRYILIAIIFFVVAYQINTIRIKQDVVVMQGDTYDVFFRSMSWRDKITTKTYLKLRFVEDPIVYPGVYRFEQSMSHKEFITTISTPPRPILVKVTLLEGRSTWDYDALLSKKGYAKSGEYRAYVTNPDVIKFATASYPFLPPGVSSLEGFLYPDTYHVDVNKPDAVAQLVQLQLQNFFDKVWSPNQNLFSNFNTILKNDGFDFKVSPYSVIKLASIVENEEKNNQNKPTIAGIFLNRIYNNIQLGADVTLCYGKSVTYDQCTPNFIVANLYDESNPYNTRKQMGLPPTPISNPTLESIIAVLAYKKTDYLYYLHDSRGRIYYGLTLQEHNTNKQRYLK